MPSLPSPTFSAPAPLASHYINIYQPGKSSWRHEACALIGSCHVLIHPLLADVLKFGEKGEHIHSIHFQFSLGDTAANDELVLIYNAEEGAVNDEKISFEPVSTLVEHINDLEYKKNASDVRDHVAAFDQLIDDLTKVNEWLMSAQAYANDLRAKMKS